MTRSYSYAVYRSGGRLVGHLCLDGDFSGQSGRELLFPILRDGVVVRHVGLTVCHAPRRGASLARLRVRESEVDSLHDVTGFMPGTILATIDDREKANAHGGGTVKSLETSAAGKIDAVRCRPCSQITRRSFR